MKRKKRNNLDNKAESRQKRAAKKRTSVSSHTHLNESVCPVIIITSMYDSRPSSGASLQISLAIVANIQSINICL